MAKKVTATEEQGAAGSASTENTTAGNGSAAENGKSPEINETGEGSKDDKEAKEDNGVKIPAMEMKPETGTEVNVQPETESKTEKSAETAPQSAPDSESESNVESIPQPQLQPQPQAQKQAQAEMPLAGSYPPSVEAILKSFPAYESLYIDSHGGIYTPTTAPVVRGNAILYKNPFYKS
jgi:hypothetical protein